MGGGGCYSAALPLLSPQVSPFTVSRHNAAMKAQTNRPGPSQRDQEPRGGSLANEQKADLKVSDCCVALLRGVKMAWPSSQRGVWLLAAGQQTQPVTVSRHGSKALGPSLHISSNQA